MGEPIQIDPKKTAREPKSMKVTGVEVKSRNDVENPEDLDIIDEWELLNGGRTLRIRSNGKIREFELSPEMMIEFHEKLNMALARNEKYRH